MFVANPHPWFGAHWVHQPYGPIAVVLDRLGQSMYWVGAVIFCLVVAALLWATFRTRAPSELPDDPAREPGMTRAVIWATVGTTLTLLAFLVLSYSTGRPLSGTPPGAPIQITVTGHQWWWGVEYSDSLPSHRFTTANEIHVPVGLPVVLRLKSADVIHSFWVPSLGGKRDLLPGDENSLWLRADRAGVYRGECAEFCGHQHANMSFDLVAEPVSEFARWLTRQRDSAHTPTDSLALRGQEVFLASSCVMCHSIQGTPAGSRIGPDLTHLASRRSIAGGTLPNTAGNLTGWITDPQRIKPGVQMPANRLEPDDMVALVKYLETLR
jgi:cytochrome c oxidase subunit II